MLVEFDWPGRRDLIALCGGEAMPAELPRQLLGRVAALWNVYGPTETTIWSAASCVLDSRTTRDAAVTIGRPIANTRIYILDEHRELVPIGVSGEIYIGGAGVARGYLNRPELTAERFIASPFVAGDRLYRTGDLARYLADGNIDCLGRNDFQVKIRGFRIELGEIETRLRAHAGVRQAIVLAREDSPGEKRLVAYYTDRGDSVSSEELRDHLLSSLPEYMVPAALVRLADLPLTANGKIDRRNLAAPDSSAFIICESEAPFGEVEQALAQIWCEVLSIERVGRHDNFFALGGHSLLAARVVSRMRKVGWSIDGDSFFTTPTLSGLASVVRRSADAIGLNPIPEESMASVAVSARQSPPVASMQAAMLFQTLLGRDSAQNGAP